MTRFLVRILVLVSIATSVAVAQNRRALTVADYDRATKMLAPALNGLVVGGTAAAAGDAAAKAMTSETIRIMTVAPQRSMLAADCSIWSAALITLEFIS